ncbi:hypothetical protein SARC_02093 [Sphaeroforma arctica JP610]|uniref:Uncharacterized protein n=1 Tax=Sphaeroforma arctica JP610 TaxID=667725 RepID=A0A0L0G9Y8_9EUKA|nr:hypothetical protein SARC_02093 [Sphaeroforma arctica JP610]KNC85719.1 hypothetical protein SARC_02093 [Sphaeroforma arctica JP610]|eukprot:XP_014159621.1 hypothetical protein SARC_02093 [Sphaeroforma arctica JP610]
MPSANTTEEEVTEISVFVAPFSQESVIFEKVAPGCAQSSRTGASSLFKIGNYNELSPWTGSFQPNPGPLNLINATSPQFGAVVSNVTHNDDMPGKTFENVNNNTIPVAGLTNGSEPVYIGNVSMNTQNGLSTTANRIVVGADVSVTLFALQNFAGESITIVGPTIQCLDIPEPDGTLTTAFQSFTVGRTWRAITGSWRQVFHPSNSAITASLTVGFRWGRATTVQAKSLRRLGLHWRKVLYSPT